MCVCVCACVRVCIRVVLGSGIGEEIIRSSALGGGGGCNTGELRLSFTRSGD